MLDAATKYMAARVIRRETTTEFIRSVQRGWIKIFGTPFSIHVDSHRAWGSEEFRDFVTDNDISLTITPGEAHNRLAQLERRHHVLCRAVEHYMTEKGSDTLEALAEALIYVIPRMNATVGIGGFSPTQWVLGYQPRLPGSLLEEGLNYSHLSPTEAFQAKLNSRSLAAASVIKADNDHRLRRALLRQHRGDPPPLHVGQRCYYWREAAGVGPRIRWKGPATVVLIESDAQQRPNVYWLIHGSALIRAAPEHVRPDFEHATLAAALTTFSDLVRTHRKRPRSDFDFNTDDELDEPDHMETDADSRLPGPALPPPFSGVPPALVPPLAPVAHPPVVPPVLPLTPSSEPEPEATPPPGSSAGPADAVSTDAFPGPDVMPLPADAVSTDAFPGPDVMPLPADDDDDNAFDDNDQPPDQTYAEALSQPTPASSVQPADHGRNAPPEPLPPMPTSVSVAYGPPPPKESFRHHRARLDRQETLPFMSLPSESSRDRSRSRHGDDERVDHAFSVDIVSGTNDHGEPYDYLPSGWIFQDGTLQLEPIHDWWEIRQGSLIRHHVVARDTRFHPAETGDCPVPLDYIKKVRLTVAGNHKHSDRWKHDEAPVTMAYWTGRTVFKLLPRWKKEAETAFYDNSHGNAVYAGTKAKRAKDAKNLNERLLDISDRLAFMEAKKKELESFFVNNVWEFDQLANVPPERVLRAHFILKWSKNPDGSPRAKARLITQGFRDPDALAGKIASTSPTLSRLGRTSLMSIAANLGWSTFVADISTAFLQGKEHASSRTLWVRLPAEARQLLGVTDPQSCMRLRKPIYGLVDAPRAWYLEACSRLERIGFQRHPLDNCLFLYFANLDDSGTANETSASSSPNLVCALGLHVDDILGAGDGGHSEVKRVKNELKEAFSFRDFREDQDVFEFLGAKVAKLKEGGFRYSHEDYLSKLKPINVDKSRMADLSAPVTETERSQLRTLVGALQWASTQTSPHLQVHTSQIAGSITSATVQTLLDANKSLRFAKSNNDVALEYVPLGDPSSLTLVTFTDAAFASRHDSSSQGGYITTLAHISVLDGAPARFHVLDWRSYRLPRVARSTLACESQAASEATDSHLFAATFLSAMLKPSYSFYDKDPYAWQNSSAVVVDAKALYDVLYRDELQANAGTDKRTYLEALVIKDKLRETKGHARWVSSERQYADGLTKIAASQLLADRLRTHQYSLVNDEDYQASRKKTATERKASAYQFAKSRASPTSTTFWTFCTAACLTTTSEASREVMLANDSINYRTVNLLYLDHVTGIITFLLMLAALLMLYTRFLPGCIRPWISSITSRTTATQTCDRPPEGFAGHQLAQGVFPRYNEEHTQTYVATDEKGTQHTSLHLCPSDPHAKRQFGVQTESGLLTLEAPNSTCSPQENLRRARHINAEQAEIIKDLRARIASMPWRQARAHDVGNVYLCPGGSVWHASYDCAMSKSTNKDIIGRRPCWYCGNTNIVVPPAPTVVVNSASNTGRP